MHELASTAFAHQQQGKLGLYISCVLVIVLQLLVEAPSPVLYARCFFDWIPIVLGSRDVGNDNLVRQVLLVIF